MQSAILFTLAYVEFGCLTSLCREPPCPWASVSRHWKVNGVGARIQSLWASVVLYQSVIEVRHKICYCA